jgi:hypothetical protein
MNRYPQTCFFFAAVLVAGSLDLAYACLIAPFRGYPATAVLQAIASGLLGPDAFTGGAGVMALGVLLHYLIIGLMALPPWWAFAKWPRLAGAAAPLGLAYGALLYAAMNHVVVPLSAAPLKPATEWTRIAPELLVHMVFVGLVLALGARRASRARRSPDA